MTVSQLIEDQFAGALKAAGLAPKEILADGKLHRFDTAKPGKKSGWYVLHGDGLAAGAFGDWATDLQETWCAKAERQFSEDERRAHQERVKAARLAAAAELASEHQAAADACATIWEKARDALADNPYCVSKGVKPLGLREFHDKRTLLIPLRDSAGKLWSLQFVDAQGRKRFKTHGKMRGCYYAFGGRPKDLLLVVEGYATGASLHDATGYPVAVAFNAGNLGIVATALRAKLPSVRIVICGDLDESETGQRAAKAAASAVGGVAVLPSFNEGALIHGRAPSDFNDMARLMGLDAVKVHVHHAIQVVGAEERSSTSVAGGVSLVRAVDIEERPIHWLWPGWLAKGKLIILAGAAGTGKTTLALGLAATVTTGGRWPDGLLCGGSGNVLVWSSEDDPADTLKPRLMACGADVRNVYFVQGVTDSITGELLPFDPARDIPTLTAAVSAIGGASLLLIDPIVSAVAGDMHRANDVRRGLQAVVDFAVGQDCAVVGITHFSKGSAGSSPQERVIGSQAFGALARTVIVAAKEEDSEARVLARAKSNISVDDGGVRYHIEPYTLESGIETTRVVWGDRIEGTARDILGAIEAPQTEESSEQDDAAEFLRGLLADGPVPSKQVKADADGAGFAWATIRRAQKSIGAEAYRAGDGIGAKGAWFWRLGRQGQDAKVLTDSPKVLIENSEHLRESLSTLGKPAGAGEEAF